MGSSTMGIVGRDLTCDPSRTQGPLGLNDAADPNKLTCSAGDTPGALGTGGDHADPTPRQLNACDNPLPGSTQEKTLLIFDLEKVAKFLKSVSIAKAQEHFVRVAWEDYSDSGVINFIYALMPWKGKAGTAVVVEGSPMDVKKMADKDMSALLEAFIHKAASGPKEAQRFLETQESLRTSAMSTVEEAFADAADINREVIAEASHGIRKLAVIKCGADIIVAVFAGPLISIGYSTVKEWAKGGEASAVALAGGTESAKKGSEHGMEKLGEKLIPEEADDIWKVRNQILAKEELIAKYEKDLIGKKGGKAAKYLGRIRRGEAELEELQKLASPTRRALGKGASGAAKGLRVIFAAKEVYESVSELKEIFEATEE